MLPRLRFFAARLALVAAGAAAIATSSAPGDPDDPLVGDPVVQRPRLEGGFSAEPILLASEVPGTRRSFMVRLNPRTHVRPQDVRARLDVGAMVRRMGEGTGTASGPHRTVVLRLTGSSSGGLFDQRISTFDPAAFPPAVFTLPFLHGCPGMCEETFNLDLELIEPAGAPGVVVDWTVGVTTDLFPEDGILEFF